MAGAYGEEGSSANVIEEHARLSSSRPDGLRSGGYGFYSVCWGKSVKGFKWLQTMKFFILVKGHFYCFVGQGI